MKAKRLLMSIDFGASLTKVIGGIDKERWGGIGIEPEVIKIVPELLNFEALGGNPENRLWVKRGDSCYALGHLAKSLANTTTRLKEPKVNQAVLKVMGAIAVFKEKYDLASHIHCSLCCVLPPGEINDRERLGRLITEVLEGGFESFGGTIKGTVTRFECRAEGTGVFIYYRTKRGPEANNMYIAVVMTGYRNLSLLNIGKGVTGTYDTSQLGFVRLVKKVQSQVTCLVEEDILVEKLSLWKETGDDNHLKDILSVPDQLETLKEAIKIAEIIYQEEIKAWLGENIHSKTQEVIIGGGTASYLKDFFREYFADKNIYFKVTQKSFPDRLRKICQEVRFEDVWCLWDYLIQDVKGFL